MKKLLLVFSLTFLPACAQLGIPPAETFNQRIAVAYSTVTAVRDTATTLLKGKRITVQDAENVQQQADNARSGLDIARTMFADGKTIPADDKLQSVSVALRALQTYLASKK